ncbi:MAG: hypothetical protein ACP5FL_05980 [Thermoplasmatota archaeon]
MKQNLRLVAGIILFGSIWGLLECALGDALHSTVLPGGAIMTGLVGFGLMAATRIMYRQPGMQLGMGALAGALKYMHPVGGCMLCSAIAIAVEGVVFELIWRSPQLRLDRLDTTSMRVSMGVISGYAMYGVGYIATQMLTPIVSGGPLIVADLAALMPRTLSHATLAGLLAGATLPALLAVPADLSERIASVRKEVYYPAASLISVLCWIGILLL